MCRQPQRPQLYIGERGGCAPSRVPTPRGTAAPRSHLGCGQGGERGNLPPKLGGCAPSPNPRRLGPLWGGGAHQPTWGWSPPTLGPCSPPGPVAPLGGPGTLPIKPETFPVTKTGLPIYKSLPPDHSGTPHDVQDLIRDSKLLGNVVISKNNPTHTQDHGDA